MPYGYMFAGQQPDEDIFMPEGPVLAGCAIGIIRSGTPAYPLFPGNVANASTFDFPVCYKVLPPFAVKQLISAKPDPFVLEQTIKAAQELQQLGCRAIVGACGYFANYLPEVASAVTIPCFLSSLMQAPTILRALGLGQKLAVICIDGPALTSAPALKNCGVEDLSRIIIVGAQDLPEVKNFMSAARRHMNSHQLELELVGLASQTVAHNPEIGAVLLECADMPPYAWAIQKAVRLPVFDYTTMINWVYQSVVRRPFAGFM